MSCQVETRVVSLPVDVRSIVLHLVAERGISDFLDRLVDILGRHRAWNDSLSLRMSRFGAEVCQLALTGSIESEVFLERLALKVGEFRTIAVNTIDRAPLVNPVMANERIWEKWMLEDIRDVYEGLSPYKDVPLEEGVPHAYGNEMIDLVESVFESTEKSDEWLKEVSVKALTLDCARMGYDSLIASEIDLESRERKIAMIERCSEVFQAVMQASEKSTKAHVEATTKILTDGDERLTQELGTIRENYDAVIGTLRGYLDQAHRERDEISTRLGRKVVELTDEVGSLKSRVTSLEARDRANYHAAHSGGGRKKLFGIF